MSSNSAAVAVGVVAAVADVVETVMWALRLLLSAEEDSGHLPVRSEVTLPSSSSVCVCVCVSHTSKREGD